jgi:hypothetical protein
VVLLTGVRAPGHSIKGLIAAVPGGDWAALDAREVGYARVPASAHVDHTHPARPEIAVYAVDPAHMTQSDSHVILLSYLDVVAQGFREVYGAEGVQHFFDTTDNWHIPIIDDRDAPIYPRHQRLTADERALVDSHLSRLSAQVKPRHEATLPPEFRL